MGPPGNQPWSFSIRAKSKDVDLRLRASRFLPGWANSGSGSSFSVFFRIRRFLLEAKSGSGDLAPREKRRSKVLHSLGKVFRRRRRSVRKEVTVEERTEVKNTGKLVTEENAAHFPFQAPVPTIMGSLSLLSHSASTKDHEGIAIHAFTFLFYLSLLFNMKKTPIPLLLVTTAITLMGFSLSYLSYTDHVPKAAWKAWVFLTSTGCLLALSQVIYSRMSLFLRNCLSGLPIFGLLPFLPYELGLGLLSKSMKAAIEAAPVWIPKMLVTCQAFFHILNEPMDLKAVGTYVSSAYFWVEIIRVLAPYLGT